MKRKNALLHTLLQIARKAVKRQHSNQNIRNALIWKLENKNCRAKTLLKKCSVVSKNKCNAALHVCRIFFLPSKGHLCGVALDFSNNRVAFFLYCVIINIIGSGSSLNRNLTDCTGPHAPSEGGLGVVPTRNFTDLLVQLQIRNNPQSAWLTCGSGDGRVAQCCIQLWRRMV